MIVETNEREKIHQLPHHQRGRRKKMKLNLYLWNLRSKFATPHLRLWACMISSGMHDSLDNPPDIPAFHSTPKRSRESMSSAITGAAKALASALEGTPKASPTDLSCTHTATGVSPSKAVDLRMKNYEQLRHL